MIKCKSFLFLAWLTQFYVFDFIDLLGVHDQLRIERVQFFRLLQILSSCLVILQCLQSKSSSEVSVTVFRLQLDHLVIVFQTFLKLVSE